MSKFILPICLSLTFGSLHAQIRHIGVGQTYATLSAAAAAAQAGDTLLMHGGTYSGGLTINNLKGKENKWITIKNVPGESVVFEGGGNAIQFIEPEYLHIIGLLFQHQTGNGVNTDDGGTYDTPAHHIIFEKCTFKDMSATGNNDLLKLSGLDHFEVRNCTFINGAAGGSGVDMVGCHHGLIRNNTFEKMGSNAIQCKGGSQYIRIEANFFRDCGQRTLNLGGSTGLSFFRPDTAHFEAADVQVYANIMVGSVAPVAYVGAVRVKVINNTIYQPEKWVARILQETVDPNRFLPCGDNTFENNVIVIGNIVSTTINIGPNTDPGSFVFANNLWYNADNGNWAGPVLPVAEQGQIKNKNPLLANPALLDFMIPSNSPAAAAGKKVTEPVYDFKNRRFANPPSIGAIEANPVSSTSVLTERPLLSWLGFPNPASEFVSIDYELYQCIDANIAIFSAAGVRIDEHHLGEQQPGKYCYTFPVQQYENGWYCISWNVKGGNAGYSWFIVHK